ncbi:MAG: TraB/GumN family protein [Planctomycetes bacterium]|nr:TraB/GumN family protein [Planctomycetota bacterium]
MAIHSSRLLSLLAGLATLLLPLPAQDSASSGPRPILWRIEGPTPSYLFGTIHLPDPRVTELPDVVQRAFDDADVVLTELPMDPKVVTEIQKASLLDGRRTLRDVLPEDLYADIETWLRGHGVPMAPLARLQPWALMAQLPLVPKLREFAAGQPLDLKLYGEARGEGKEVGGLETVDEQLAVFVSFALDEQITMLRESFDLLRDAEAKGEDPVEKMIELYISGDVPALLREMNDYQFSDPELQRRVYDALLWERNETMADRIAERLRAAPGRTHFFAVGAGHMGPGERPSELGVIALLEAHGLTLTRLPERAEDVDAKIHDLERELQRLRERAARLRRAG